jgi:cytochrome c-type biogenesis protein CcmE
MNAKVKFGLVTVAILGTLIWLGTAGVGESATYYVTVKELKEMPDAMTRRLRVGGDVEVGSIVRNDNRVEFTITQEDQKLSVVYVGDDPLPDTFRDRAQALCEGRLRSDNVFEAHKIQAKCASKYESDPGEKANPVYESVPGDKVS